MATIDDNNNNNDTMMGIIFTARLSIAIACRPHALNKS